MTEEIKDIDRLKDRIKILEHAVYSINQYLIENKIITNTLSDLKYEFTNLERKRLQIEELTKQIKEERRLLQNLEDKKHVEKKTRRNKK
jgi:hypothetical protein